MPKMEELVQVLLERKEGHCLINMICWLPIEARVKTGAIVSLKNQDGRWQIKEMYNRALRADIRQSWRVGGLV